MQTHLLHSGKSTQFHGSSYGGAAELRGDVVAWLAFPCIRAHRMRLVEAAPAPALSWLRQGHYCTMGSSSAVCGGTTCGACLHNLGMAHTFQCMATSPWFPTPVHGRIPLPHALNATRQRKPKDVTWDCRNCGIAQDCRVTWGHIGQGVQTGSTARRGLQFPTL